MNITVSPPNTIRGELITPSDKSISHRSVIFNSISKGISNISNFSDGDDCISTLEVLKKLGVKITQSNQNNSGLSLRIEGIGENLFPNNNLELNAGNSGTTIRLMSGILASKSNGYTLTGDISLCSRPMERITSPLNLMGANINSTNGFPPLYFSEKKQILKGIQYSMPISSAQVKSAVILAALNAKSDTAITQPSLSRDHSERMLTSMGAKIKLINNLIHVKPSSLSSIDLEIPGDISSASYWIVAGLIHKNAELTIKNVGVNPSRIGILNVLKRMKANFSLTNNKIIGNEPVADINVSSSELIGTTIEGDEIPLLIDEIPIICIAASLAQGQTLIKDANELRVKESDRLESISNVLSKLNVKHINNNDGILIFGSKKLSGGTHKTFGDHRIAMSIGIAGLVSEDSINIKNAEVASISYKDFWSHLKMISEQ
ncbi:MAG: 3-phosphoshikimate 1-carboxyvinyltransferase [Chloroflexi bacterium]|nr:3-phosphoshikimate 1-carboxyvinyltransferase [Chloroflexota bacterium]|tara:strand:- start:4839 stop:6137 length:1299 start_codon:yes stop_codon:yes gene_type:complete